jgi:DNA-binding YbaB/EbfC family protein
MFNIQKMMKQAQEMQMKLQEVQEKLKDIIVEGEAGGGLVKVKMTCAGKATNVDIDESLLGTDKETLEDLITAAINTANDIKEERI